MFQINKKNIQKYVNDRLMDVTKTRIVFRELPYYYEGTITFNPQYWSHAHSLRGVSWSMEDLIKPLIRGGYSFHLRYCVEYLKTSPYYPHVHFQVQTDYMIDPSIQQQIHGRNCRRYGRSQWFQTGTEDRYHENSKMLWSEYIKKERVENEKSGLQHYYEYCL